MGGYFFLFTWFPGGNRSTVKTSQRFARKHPEELGFSKFLLARSPNNGRLKCMPEIAKLFQEAAVQLYFVPGNHEEHQYIGNIWYNFASSLRNPVKVDYDWEGIADGLYGEDDFRGYGNLLVLPEGPVVNMKQFFNKESNHTDKGASIRAINGLQSYTMPEAWNEGNGKNVDILLSHETYKGRLKGLHPTGQLDKAGSEDLLKLIQKVGPTHHFFGHYHWYYLEVQIPNDHGGITRSVGLNEVNFEKTTSKILPGCFGIIKIHDQGDEITFEIVEDEWFRNLRLEDCTPFL